MLQIGGFDPFTSPDAARSRFVRELSRFERVWSAVTTVGPPQIDADQIVWTAKAHGAGWDTVSEFHIIRWDDIIHDLAGQPMWLRLWKGFVSFIYFLAGGALLRYAATASQYAVFFLYPFAAACILMAISGLAGLGVAQFFGSVILGGLISVVVTRAMYLGPWRWLHLGTLFDDWIFSARYIHADDPVLSARLEAAARELVEAARAAKVDEIVVVGHSLGAVLAVDLLDRALRHDPKLGCSGPAVTFLSIGSSLLKIGLHRGATRFRAALCRVGAAPGVLWGEYQARIDVMNFYNRDPMRDMGLPAARNLEVRLVDFRATLERDTYRRMRTRLFRVHCQFISGNDRRAAYDYFMLLCGPVSARHQTLAPDGALSALAADGSLPDPRLLPRPATSLSVAATPARHEPPTPPWTGEAILQ